MKVLITGGDGYLGRNIVESLKNHKDISDIVIASRKQGNDITSPQSMLDATKGVDIVFHMAADPLVTSCEKNPEKAFRTNVYGTRNVLEACKENGVKWLLFPSSVHVYGELRNLPVDEEHPLNPTNVYGITKLLGEELCQIYRRYFPITVMRFFNIYGPGQEKRVIPDFIEKARSGKIDVLGDGRQTVDFIHIDDAVLACMAAMDKMDSGIYNVASGREVSLNDIAEIVSGEFGGVEIIHKKSQIRGQARILADTTRIKKHLEWEPVVDIRQGIKEIIS
jgi:UDP-glucose 4-epimerase